MFAINQIASGSSGNCYHLTEGDNSLLIECGIRYKLIQQGIHYKVTGLDGCIVSHSHKDHSRSIDQLAAAGVDIFISHNTKDELLYSKPHHRIKTFTRKRFKINNWSILPFKLQHDVTNHGFMIDSEYGKRIIYITDSYYCRYRFPHANVYMVECNYSRKILDNNVKNDKISSVLRNRVLQSHFSLENVLEFFKANDLSHCQAIYLLHISSTNGDKELFKNKVQKLTGIPTYA